MWGYISKYLGTFGSATFNIVTVLLGAIILWDLLSRIQQGVMMAFLEDIWSYNFINYFSSPLKIGEYLSGLVLTSLATGIFGFLVTMALAAAVFGYNIFVIGLAILPFIVILFIFGIAIGIFVSALIFRLGSSAEWIAWPIPFVLSIFSGVYYPISTLPHFLQIFTKIIPASYVFESMRTIVSHGGFTWAVGINLLISFVLSLLYLWAMYLFFIKVYKRNLSVGTIARFNTE
jgi:ABC-2 type transport system permease protein